MELLFDLIFDLFFSVLPFIIIAYVIKGVSKAKKKDQKQNKDSSLPEFKQEITNVNKQVNENKETTYCDYCGSVMKKTDKKCKSCGAKYTVNKDK